MSSQPQKTTAKVSKEKLGAREYLDNPVCDAYISFLIDFRGVRHELLTGWDARGCAKAFNGTDVVSSVKAMTPIRRHWDGWIASPLIFDISP